MRTPAARFVVVLPFFLLASCTSNKDRAPHVALDAYPTYEELATAVPRDFSDSQKWNSDKLCPEGSTLTPFTRYMAEPSDAVQGSKYYYGRSCAFVEVNDAELDPGRNPASMTPPDTMQSVSILPHGPFIWWYENGKKMETGSFDHGTLTANVTRYATDGSINKR